jgi:HK97 family phage major capsid protein
MEDGVLAHAEDPDHGVVMPGQNDATTYGLYPVDYLFPDYKSMNTPPEFIKREMGWVTRVMNGAHHTPFSRIKSVFANITEDEARALGYIKGNQKKNEVFSLLKRTTDPQTVYKKQKMDRDDIIDITDFDVVAWLKSEMRMMLDEELARAILIGDGRLASDDDHISEDHIRSIVNDADLFTIKKGVNMSGTDPYKTLIADAIRARKDYKGSGTPVMFTTEEVLTEMLLLEDGIGHPLYADEAALARKLRVSSIVTVPVMEGAKTSAGKDLLGVIVNMSDYNIGADKGGAVNMFDDFDINYNQFLYLIETRISGALTKPYSAIVLYNNAAVSAG